MATQQFPVTNNVGQPQILIANGSSLPGPSFIFSPAAAPANTHQPGQPQTIICAGPQPTQQLTTYLLQHNIPQAAPGPPTLIQLPDGRFAFAQTPQRPIFQHATALRPANTTIGQVVARPPQLIVQSGAPSVLSNFGGVKFQSNVSCTSLIANSAQPVMASASSNTPINLNTLSMGSLAATSIPTGQHDSSFIIQTPQSFVNGQTPLDSNKSSEEILKRLTNQIENLSSSPTPLAPDKQAQLLQLRNLHQEILKNSKEELIDKSNFSYDKSQFSQVNTKSVQSPVSLPQSLVIQPSLKVLDSAKKEILSNFQRLGLMPKCSLNASLVDTFIVEFRLGKQGYKLRLSRSQKEAMEGYLQGKTSQKQAEILSIFIHEQSALQSTDTTSQYLPLNIQQVFGSQTTQASNSLISTHSSSGTTLLSGSPLASARPIPTGAQFMTIGRSTSLIAASTNGPSSFPIPSTGFQKSSIISTDNILNNTSNCTTLLSTTGLSLSSHLNTTQSINPPMNVASSKTLTTAPVTITQRQARSMMEFRKMLNADIHEVTNQKIKVPDKISSKDLQMKSMLEKLAPYHILQDTDHSEEALEKTDEILNRALDILGKRTKMALEVANAVLLKESHDAFHSPVEDRLLIDRMTLDLQREVFETEKKAFERALKAFSRRYDDESDYEPDMSNIPLPRKGRKRRKRSSSYNPSKQPLFDTKGNPLPPAVLVGLGKLADFVPLKFDENGNIERARLNLEGPLQPSISKKSVEPDSYSDIRDAATALLMFHSISNSNNNHSSETQRGSTTNNQTTFDENYNLWQEFVLQEQEEHLLRSDSSQTELDNDNEYGFEEPVLSRKPSGELKNIRSGDQETLIAVAQDLEAEMAAEAIMDDEDSSDPQQHSEDPDIDAAIRSILH